MLSHDGTDIIPIEAETGCRLTNSILGTLASIHRQSGNQSIHETETPFLWLLVPNLRPEFGFIYAGYRLYV